MQKLDQYCSECIKTTRWKEYQNFWQCDSCKRILNKMPYEDAVKRLEDIQQQWADLEKVMPLSMKKSLNHQAGLLSLDYNLSKARMEVYDTDDLESFR